MIYINCPSFSSVFYLLKEKERNEVTAITINKSVLKYCQLIGVKCLYLEYIGIEIRKLQRLSKFKNQIDNLLESISFSPSDAFVLLDSTYSLEGFYLASQLSKRIKVYFGELAPFPNASIAPYIFTIGYLKALVVKTVIEKILNIDLQILYDRSLPLFSINETFLKKHGISPLELNLYELAGNVMEKQKYISKEYDIMLIDQGKMEKEIIPDSKRALYKAIIQNVKRKIAIKEHPNFKDKELESADNKLPDYIPVEMLFKNIKETVIGVYSTSLILAAKLSGLKVLSLLEIVDWHDKEYKEHIKKWLTEESEGKIIFVKSKEELLERLSLPEILN